MIVILDNIRSIHNVASIFRTADGAGVEKIYLVGVTPLPLDKWGRPTRGFNKVSLGAENSVPWEHTPDLKELVLELRLQGLTVAALEQHPTAVNIYDIQNPPAAIILGTETLGLNTEILNEVDQIIEIPMRGRKESLNVSVAFGVAAYILLQ